MKVKVLFFVATADVAGKRSNEIDVADGSTSGAVFDAVLSSYPAIRSHKLLFAVNQEYSDGSEKLREGDELAVFTAVSGG